MKQKTWDGKFTIQIKDGYLENSVRYIKSKKVAPIKMFAEKSSVTLEEVADAIISCTFRGMGLTRIIDGERYTSLDICLKIPKTPVTNVTYNFNIPNYQSTEKILPAIACDITI